MIARHATLFLAACLLAMVVTPFAIRLAIRVNLLDLPGPAKFHDRPTAYLGGLAVLIGVLAATVIAVAGKGHLRAEFVAVGAGGAMLALVGLLDDRRPLTRVTRVSAQLAAGIGLWVVHIRVTPTPIPALNAALSLILVVVLTNSVNLLDHMDGLSAGIVAIACSFLFLLSFLEGQHRVGALAAALAGACVGFLPYNFTRARVFLGDTGTQFMGFVLASLVMSLHVRGAPGVVRAMVPLLVVSVPLLDTALVVVSRWRHGRPILAGGTDHSGHRLVRLGLRQPRAALALYGLGAAGGAATLLLHRFPTAGAGWTTLAVAVAAGVAWITVMERAPSAPARDPNRPTAQPEGPPGLRARPA